MIKMTKEQLINFETDIFFDSSFNVFFSRINLGLHISNNTNTIIT